MQAGQQQPYPTNMQTGYQVPPPGGYPPAQYGNQPMPGYPPQQQFAPQQQYPGGYPPAQQGYAENQQTKPFIDPSAPPPPYTN
ncbi:hypothetical protein MAR_011335 [Mya arenaria]|uniref:Rhodopsin n=2 Tax=Mya arenaria TaxID=6604 RepID=A0ABY7G2V5_MYAAR|nr:hypothetical protein MAR_011335 [Mya arenaria]